MFFFQQCNVWWDIQVMFAEIEEVKRYTNQKKKIVYLFFCFHISKKFDSRFFRISKQGPHPTKF